MVSGKEAGHLLVTLTSVVLLLAGMARTSFPDGSREYCSSEAFDVRCLEGEVILMQSARYGRMQPGRCITGDYTHSINCWADVLGHLDSACSGRLACTVVVGSLDAVTQPCNKDFKSYLEASYKCVKALPHRLRTSLLGGTVIQATVHRPQPTICDARDPMVLEGSSGYLGRDTIIANSLDSSRCVWHVKVNSGQTISMTLYTFRQSARHKGENDQKSDFSLDGSQDGCAWHVTVREGLETTRRELCALDKRDSNFYQSKGNKLDIYFTGNARADTVPYFVLEYKASGCPDLAVPKGAWLQRDSDNLRMRCNDTSETWYLTCRDGLWIGDIGNCSSRGSGVAARRVPKGGHFLQEAGVVFAVVIGVVLGLIIGTSMLGIVFVCRKRRRNPSDFPGIETQPATDQRTVTNTPSYPALLRQEKPIGGNICEYTHVWEVRPSAMTSTGPGPVTAATVSATRGDLQTFGKGIPVTDFKKKPRPFDIATGDSVPICRRSDPPLYFELAPQDERSCSA